jgi:hypothetical protein
MIFGRSGFVDPVSFVAHLGSWIAIAIAIQVLVASSINFYISDLRGDDPILFIWVVRIIFGLGILFFLVKGKELFTSKLVKVPPGSYGVLKIFGTIHPIYLKNGDYRLLSFLSFVIVSFQELQFYVTVDKDAVDKNGLPLTIKALVRSRPVMLYEMALLIGSAKDYTGSTLPTQIAFFQASMDTILRTYILDYSYDDLKSIGTQDYETKVRKFFSMNGVTGYASRTQQRNPQCIMAKPLFSLITELDIESIIASPEIMKAQEAIVIESYERQSEEEQAKTLTLNAQRQAADFPGLPPEVYYNTAQLIAGLRKPIETKRIEFDSGGGENANFDALLAILADYMGRGK